MLFGGNFRVQGPSIAMVRHTPSEDDFSSYNFRRRSGRNRGVLDSEDDAENRIDARNVSSSGPKKPATRSTIRAINTSFNESDLEEQTPKLSRFRRTLPVNNSDEDEAYTRTPSTQSSSPSSSASSASSASDSESSAAGTDDDELVQIQRSKRLRAQEKEARARRLRSRMSESEKLRSSFRQHDPNPSKQVEEDAALAAALAAGYYSDDERAIREAASSSAHYNPYERRFGYNERPPPRRSGRAAAVASAARVAFYSSLINPESNVHDLIGTPHNNPQSRYNLRSNRSTPTTTVGNNSIFNEFMAEGFDPHALLPTHLSRHHQSGLDDRLFDDGMNNRNEAAGTQSGEGATGEDGNHVSEGQQASGTLSMAALDQIAGMDGYVRKLKEMIVFPLIYPHLFEKLNISLPRGVLFHGPPGTGKTLMARLLAEACSTSTRKVTFFMRNGSDCLSKWIGEAERNMRLLFKKAKECQPAIIFFDEIDGLAPERTGRQDQSHISLVSTLLALMDGLDDRGQVVVIGATNRIHSIDSALRRPGRFDREFYFGLPDEPARTKILQIHTKTWDPPIDESLAQELASRTSGFSGADMKALCVEAALRAVQRSFPQVYHSSKPIDSAQLDSSQVKVTAADFEHALLYMNPSTKRHSSRSDLVAHQKPQLHLYSTQMTSILSGLIRPRIKRTFAQDSSGKASWQVTQPLIVRITYASQCHPDAFVWRFMCGVAESLDGFTLDPVDLTAELSANSSESIEGAIWRVLNGLRGKGPVCVLLKPFYSLGAKAAKSVRSALQMFAKSLLPGEPLIVLYMLKKSSPIVNSLTGIETFHLGEPDLHQVSEYRRTVLQTLYRMLAVDFALPLAEDELVRASFDRLPSAANVFDLESLKMDWTDQLLTDPQSFFQLATGSDHFIEAHARVEEPEEPAAMETGSTENVASIETELVEDEEDSDSDSSSSGSSEPPSDLL